MENFNLLALFFGLLEWTLHNFTAFFGLIALGAAFLATALVASFLIGLFGILLWGLYIPFWAVLRRRNYEAACAENPMLPTNFVAWFIYMGVLIFAGRYGAVNFTRAFCTGLFTFFISLAYFVQGFVTFMKGADDGLYNFVKRLPTMLWQMEDPVAKFNKLQNGIRNAVKKNVKPLAKEAHFYHNASVHLLSLLLQAQASGASAKQVMAYIQPVTEYKKLLAEAENASVYRQEYNRLQTVITNTKKLPNDIREDETLDPDTDD